MYASEGDKLIWEAGSVKDKKKKSRFELTTFFLAKWNW